MQNVPNTATNEIDSVERENEDSDGEYEKEVEQSIEQETDSDEEGDRNNISESSNEAFNSVGDDDLTAKMTSK